jgi:hypothetical protein
MGSVIAPSPQDSPDLLYKLAVVPNWREETDTTEAWSSKPSVSLCWWTQISAFSVFGSGAACFKCAVLFENFNAFMPRHVRKTVVCLRGEIDNRSDVFLDPELALV